MSVLVLMYHRTPKAGADGPFDMAFSRFCDQIQALLDQGCRFIRFSETLDPRCYAEGTQVCVTFDDGHASNIEAVEFLAAAGITPALFVVREWSRNNADYISAAAMRRMADVCEFGSHGCTHTAMTALAPLALEQELTHSKDYLEQVLARPVNLLAYPGGMFSARVTKAAKATGYAVIGDSIALINARPGATVHRITLKNGDGPLAAARLAAAPQAFWLGKRVHRLASIGLSAALGPSRYRALSQGVKGALAHTAHKASRLSMGRAAAAASRRATISPEGRPGST